MVLLTIVTGAYRPTYNWGASHCWMIGQCYGTIHTIRTDGFPHLKILTVKPSEAPQLCYFGFTLQESVVMFASLAGFIWLQ